MLIIKKLINVKSPFLVLTIVIFVVLSISVLVHEFNTLSKENKELKGKNEEIRTTILQLEEENKQVKSKAQELEITNNELEDKIINLENRINSLTNSKKEVTRGSYKKTHTFEATAYDLTVASCGKGTDHPQYGITRSGLSLVGKDIKDKYIAVDPSVIPLGSKVYVEFFEPYKHLNGTYTAVDTGGAIKGRKIDVYFGELNVSKQVSNFGRRKVKVSY